MPESLTFQRGIDGDLNSGSKQFIAQGAEQIATVRSARNSMTMVFFDASSANVWGDT